MADVSDYTEARAKAFCEALESGLPPALAAKTIGFSVSTVYHWRSKFPDFAQRWADAIAVAIGRIEQLLYRAGLDGQLAAQIFYLRSMAPLTYDRACLSRINEQRWRMVQAGYPPGPGITVDEYNWPIVARAADTRPKLHLYLPRNGREAPAREPLPPELPEGVREAIAGGEQPTAQNPLLKNPEYSDIEQAGNGLTAPEVPADTPAESAVEVPAGLSAESDAEIPAVPAEVTAEQLAIPRSPPPPARHIPDNSAQMARWKALAS